MKSRLVLLLALVSVGVSLYVAVTVRQLGQHIRVRTDVQALHLRGPNTYNGETGSYSQVNLYPTHWAIWGGTQPNGHAVYGDQQSIYPREDGTMSLGSDSERWKDLRLAGNIQVGSLAGDDMRYACVTADGTVVALDHPCLVYLMQRGTVKAEDARITALEARVAALEARLGPPAQVPEMPPPMPPGSPVPPPFRQPGPPNVNAVPTPIP